MSPAKAVVKRDPTSTSEAAENVVRSAPASVSQIPPRLPNALAGTEPPRSPASPVAIMARRRDQSSNFQARTPVITGEATFRGMMPVDGIISGQLGATGSVLTVKQRPHRGPAESEPDLTGEIGFKDMLRVNGHIAGKVTSERGTLIVDVSAMVDGDIDVGSVVVSGVVNGDVIAHDRVEIGAAAVVNGNISTRALTMKTGAVFEGDCRMLKNENGDS